MVFCFYAGLFFFAYSRYFGANDGLGERWLPVMTVKKANSSFGVRYNAAD